MLNKFGSNIKTIYECEETKKIGQKCCNFITFQKQNKNLI